MKNLRNFHKFLILCGVLVDFVEASVIFQQVTIESDKRPEVESGKNYLSIPKSELLSGNFENLFDVSIIAREGRIKSVCVQAGLWGLFYAENYSQIGAILYTSGLPEDRACTNEPRNETKPQYKSVRHIGHRELTRPGISFYSGSFFTHGELYFDGFRLSLYLPLTIRSYGFTGKENWTVFSEPNFFGRSTCLLSAFFEPDLTYDTVVYNKEVNLTVASVLRGCEGDMSTMIFPTGEVKLNEDQRNRVIEFAASNDLSLTEVNSLGTVLTDGDQLRLPYTYNLTVKVNVSGNDSWTVFGGTNFEGKSHCVLPGDKSKADAEVSMRIGSVKRGCHQESLREPRLLKDPPTSNPPPTHRPTLEASPINRLFFTSFVIALMILILFILTAMVSITCVYFRRCRE